MGTTVYNEDFYASQREGSNRSAKVVAPILNDIVRPASVLDVGCGVGTWACEFVRLGVPVVRGIDGDYVDRAALMIPSDFFTSADLKVPFDLGRQFDLVVSLEVAEHLPSSSAATFVESLVRHGKVIAFSAAIPGQGGTDHINEQFADYWVELFEKHKYRCVDCVRRLVWRNESVAHCYRQNLLLFVSDRDPVPHLHLSGDAGANPQVSAIHPDVYWFFRQREHDPRFMSFREAFRVALWLPRLLVRDAMLSAKRRLRGMWNK